jgi:hypothetical protein
LNTPLRPWIVREQVSLRVTAKGLEGVRCFSPLVARAVLESAQPEDDTDLIERVLGKYEDVVSSYRATRLEHEASKT